MSFAEELRAVPLLIRVNPILSAAPRQGPAAGTCSSVGRARRRGRWGFPSRQSVQLPP